MNAPCAITAPSRQRRGHTHACAGKHTDGLHKCADRTCRRWFWVGRAER